VRAAEIPGSLVGDLLPQEKLDSQWAGNSGGYQPRLQKDESQGTSSSEGSLTPNAFPDGPPHAKFSRIFSLHSKRLALSGAVQPQIQMELIRKLDNAREVDIHVECALECFSRGPWPAAQASAMRFAR
jgi:hypothetical protein